MVLDDVTAFKVDGSAHFESALADFWEFDTSKGRDILGPFS